MNFIKKYKLSIILTRIFIPVFLGFIFLYPGNANASILGTLVSFSVENMMLDMLSWVFTIVGKFLAFSVWLLGLVVRMPVYSENLPVIRENWRLIRDLANFAFIIGLIVMAYGTIFKYGNFSFKSSWFFRLVGTAVLVNFSLIIGITIIQGFQILTNVLLGTIGNLADRLGEGLNVAQIFRTASQDNGLASLTQASANASLTGVFLIIMMFMVASVTLTSALLVIVRIPVLWYLLIIAPFKWVYSSIMPGDKGMSEWWQEFISWNAFLPIYLFFFYVGLTIMTKSTEVVSAIAGSYANQPLIEGVPISTFQILFTYGLSVAFMSMGLKKGLTFLKGDAFNRLNANATFKSALGYASSPKSIYQSTPAGRRIEALQKAVSMRGAEFKERGFNNRYLNKLYGGREGNNRIEAGIISKFGPASKRGALADQISSDVKRFESQMKGKSTSELLSMRTANMTDAQKMARLELLRSRGALTGNQIRDMFNEYKRMDSTGSAAKKFASELDYEKLDSAARTSFAGLIGSDIKDESIIKKIREAQAKSGDLDAATMGIISRNLYSSIADANVKDAQMEAFINMGKDKVMEKLASDPAFDARKLAQATRDMYANISDPTRKSRQMEAFINMGKDKVMEKLSSDPAFDAKKLAQATKELYTHISDPAKKARQMEAFINSAKEKTPLIAAEAKLRSGLSVKDVNGRDLTWDDTWETGDPTTGAPPKPRMVNNRIKAVAEAVASQGSIKDEEIVRIIKQSSRNNPIRSGVIRGMKMSTANRIANDASPADVVKLQAIADEAQDREITERATRLDDHIADLNTKYLDLLSRIHAGGLTPTRETTLRKQADLIDKRINIKRKQRTKITRDYGI